MERRTFLKRGGVLSVLVAGGAVWRICDQGIFSIGEGQAYEPWKNWRREDGKGPLALVRAAILAANPHNTQPWLFKVTDKWIELFADTGRNLGSFDPYLREMHLGLGCAIENMILAAAANGYEAKVVLSEGRLGRTPETPEQRLVARLELSPGEPARSKLYEAIPKRHTNRGPYIDQPLPPEFLVELRRVSENDPDLNLLLYTDKEDKRQFGDAVIKATETIIADADMVQDSEKWYRHSWDDVQEFRDGPTIDAFGLPPLMRAVAKILPPSPAETSHRLWLDATRDVHVATAPVFGLIVVRDLYERAQALRAGRVWQRLHLIATSHDIAMQPLNQPVEIVDRERQLNKETRAPQILAALTGDPTWKPTFAFRAGYPERGALASPRRGLEQALA